MSYNIRMVFQTCKKKGFTLVELLVTTSIFVFITALLLTKYGNFNQSVLLTNLAYDIALTIRTAQTYGLSVQKSTGSATSFRYAYGVHFDTTSNSNSQKIILFTDSNGNKIFDSGSDESVSTYNIKRGAKILVLCTADCSNPDNNLTSADVTFLRPNPDANICVKGIANCTSEVYLKIIVQATDGGTRNVVIRRTGQVSVE